MPAQIIFLLLMTLLTRPEQASAQLADLYALISKQVYETINGDCQALASSDFNTARLCSLDPAKYPVKTLEAVAESTFLGDEAEAEVGRLNCSIQKAAVVAGNAAIRERILNDMTVKARAGADVYKLLVPARAALYQQRQKTNNLRPAGFQAAPSAMFLDESAKLETKEREVERLEGLLAGIVNSTWNGGTKAVSSALMKAIKSGETDLDTIGMQLFTRMPEMFKDLDEELKDNKKTLLDQKRTNPRVKGTWDLDTATKRQILARAQQNNSFAKKFPDSPNLARGLQCRLEGKYGKGQDYADNLLFAGSLATAGVGSLLTKAPQVLKATLAAGTKAGHITEQAAKVMLFTGTGVTSASVIKQIDKECLTNRPSGSVRKKVCSASEAEVIGFEIAALEEGNCALAILTSGVPIGMVATLGKALKDVSLNPTKLMASLRAKGLKKFEEVDTRYKRVATVSVDDLRKRDQELRAFVEANGGQVEKPKPRMVKNSKRAAAEKKIENLEQKITDVKAGTEPSFKIYYDSGKKALERADLKLKEAQTRLKAAENNRVRLAHEDEQARVAAHTKSREKISTLKDDYEKSIAAIKEKAETELKKLNDERSELISKGKDTSLVDRSIKWAHERQQKEFDYAEQSFKRQVEYGERYLQQELEMIDRRQAWNGDREVKREQEALARAQTDVAKAQENLNGLAPKRIEELQALIEREKAGLARLPEETPETGLQVSGFLAGAMKGEIKLIGDRPASADGPPFSLYNISKLPTKKGPARYDTPTLLHPDFQKDLARLKELGVEVRLDPTLGISGTQAFYSPNPGKYPLLHIRADSPYHYFKHEMQHAEFDHWVTKKLNVARTAVSKGESLTSVFTEAEIKSIGSEKLNRLESLLKTQNTNLAIDETMAVDAQLAQIGYRRVPSRTFVANEVYAVWHQLTGYREIINRGPPTAVQLAQYDRSLKKLGLMLSYYEGSQRAQQFIQSVATPSGQSLLAIANKLQNLHPEAIKETPILYDQNGNLLYQSQDGSWEKMVFSDTQARK